MTVSFSALRYGTTVYEADGASLDPVKYDAALSPEEDRAARVVVAFQSALESLACRTRWRGSPQRVRA